MTNGSDEEARIRICVVGAGVCGLQAAGILSSQGLNVTVFEARDRVGGRIAQSTELGFELDIGANWIHGDQNNPIVKLAQDAQSITAACGIVSSICDRFGSWMKRDKATVLYDNVWKILDLACDCSAEHSSNIGEDATMMDYFRRQVDSVSDPDSRYALEMLDVVEMWGAFIGTDCESQSLKNRYLEEGIEGDNLFVASTYKNILERMAEPLIKTARIRLSTEVVRIESDLEAGVVYVSSRNGRKESFDHVVCTCPLGWLKEHKSTFVPGLPPRLELAIDNIGVGNLDKVFIRFSSAFWHTSTNPFPIETLFLKPTYAGDTNPRQWRQEMVSLASLPTPHARPVLMFYIYGEWGAHITALVRGLPQKSEDYDRVLDAHFRPYYSRLPGYDAADPRCAPLGFLSTDWQGDEFAGHGSFCNYPVGRGDALADIAVLREGLRERRVWFAGDYTAPTKGLGTVAGAYWSGEYVATEILKLYRGESDKDIP